MGLFQRKQQYTSAAPLYSVGATRTVLVIGLGNPGKEYSGTRHNIGSEILDNFAKLNDFPDWTLRKDLKCVLCSQNIGTNRVLLCKPTTFMNLSGEAAWAIQHFYRAFNQDTLAVYDELAIPFGQIRTRIGGSDAGHNGVKSLIHRLGDDFGRLRVGIGSDRARNSSEFVLKPFSKEEKESLDLIIKEAAAMVGEFTASGSLSPETRKLL